MMINMAYAATTTATPSTGGAMQLLPMLVIFMVFMYFFVIRPQNKRAKIHKNLMSSLTKGDEILTNGGLVGKIAKLNEDYVHLMIAKDVEIVMQKHCIVSLLPKGTLKAL